MLPRKVNVDAVCKVGDFSGNHVGGSVAHESLLAVLASEVARILDNFSATVITHASSVENPFVIFNSRNVAI